MANPEEAGLEVLNRLKSTEPPIWLAPNPSLSQETRTASLQLFSSLKPFCAKSPFDQLLVEGFDAEQIWQQIDLQSQPLLSSLRRELRRLEKKPEEISRLFGDGVILGNERKDLGGREGGKESENEDADGLDGVEMDLDEFDEDEEEDGESDEGEEEGSKEGGFEGEESEDEEKRKEGGGIEDGFLKIKELEEFLLKDEAREYGLGDAGGKKRLNKRPKSVSEEDEDEDDEEEEQEEEEEEDDDEDEEEVELGEFDEEQDDLGNVRYGDFFGAKQKKVTQRKSKWRDEVEEYSTDSEEAEDGVEGNHTLSTHEKELLKLKDKVKQMEKASLELQGEGNHTLSTHEKELLNLKDKIKQMEKANLEPKTWTMQGEVTAAKRPKNSALEVDLDFEQTSRPAPVITEEVTASLEELIRNRVIEGHFDDVEKPPSLPTKGPRELKELDENKSGKGLAEIYEEEYAQKSNLASAPLTFSDELRNEANFLFKKLCLKLDALSHFHFAPKPVIEDMSIQANVPALAMEEIAPLAVSDAAMLAPEEVFAGKGDIKDETELTQADRKRRRAKKKRIYKAKEAKRMAKKARVSAVVESNEGKEE